jgi:hypothetical protein
MFIEVTRITYLMDARGVVERSVFEQEFINTEHIISFALNDGCGETETCITFDNGNMMYVAHTPTWLMAKINGHDC